MKTNGLQKQKTAISALVKYQWPLIDEEIEKVVVKQLYDKISIYDKSGIIDEFEQNFAGFIGVKYGLATCSGTAALHSAYFALDIKPGDEVIVPVYTFFATAMPLFQLGAIPVLADCLPDGTINPAEIKRKITTKTKAVAITHIWGVPCQMDEIVAICEENKLKLVEDCSHAHGATFKGKKVGSFGDVAAFSLQGKKIITAGEGGILCTNNKVIYDKAILLGHFNLRALNEISPDKEYYKYAATGLGLKYRAHPLGIAIANAQLPKLTTWIENKQINARRIADAIARVKGLEPVFKNDEYRKSAFYTFMIRVTDECVFTAHELVDFFHLNYFVDIEVPDSTIPLSDYETFKSPITPVYEYPTTFVTKSYPVAEQLARSVLKVSVPVEVEKGSRGDLFLSAFERVIEMI